MLQLLASRYTRDDFECMLTILTNGINSVCDGVCESCAFDRACADVMRVNTHIAGRLATEKTDSE